MMRTLYTLFLCVCTVLLLSGSALTAGADDDLSPNVPTAAPLTQAPEEEVLAPTPGVTAEQLSAISLHDIADDAPFRSAVAYGMAAGYLQGDGTGRYMPDDLVTRAVTVTVLERMKPETEQVVYDGRFPDVTAQDWCADAVAWGVEAGIVTGDEDGSFYPDRLVTRQQLAILLYRCAQRWDCLGQPGTIVEYAPDLDGVAEYARPAVEWAVEQGLFSGVAVGRFHPQLPVSRAQLAQVLLALEALGEDKPLAAQLVAELPQESPPKDDISDQYALVQAKVDAVARQYGAIGLQVAVVENGDVSATFAYGWATKDVAPMTADHKLRVASLSKVVVSMGAMHLLEEGTIDLDGPAGAYWGTTFRNPYHPNTPITIRGMLTHTSSIFLGGDDVSRRYDAVKSRLSSGKGYSRVTPGALSSWGYNNYAYGVLGMTLELAAGCTMDQVVDEAYFIPMGIDAAFESGSIKNTDLLCTLYQRGGTVSRTVATQKKYVANATPGSTGSSFAGGFTTSAADMGKLVALLTGDGSYQGLRLLGADRVALMEQKSAATVSDGFYQCMPLRYRTNIYGRGGLYYHTGSAYGVYNCMSYDPVTGDGVVVLSTGASGARDAYGIYAVCGELQTAIYDVLQGGAA